VNLKKMSQLIVLIVFFISGCGSSNTSTAVNPGGGAPTNTTIDFNLFPPNFFNGYNVATSLVGTDNIGLTYTGSISEKTLTPSVFLSKSSIPLETKIEFRASNGGFADALINTHYSSDPNNRELLGVDGDIVTVSANTTVIPETAKIGDSGMIGTYVDSRGFETSLSWRLDDGQNGNAKLVLLNNTNDQLGTLDNTVSTSYLIQPNGNRISIELITFNINVNIEVTLNGTF